MKIKLALGALATALLLSACGSHEEATTTEPAAPAAETTPAPAPEATPPADTTTPPPADSTATPPADGAAAPAPAETPPASAPQH